MKTELMNLKGKGLCIVISDINPNDFLHNSFSKIGVAENGDIFSDVYIIARHIREGKKIAAIKEVRQQTNWCLRESKEYIDRFLEPGFFNNYHECVDAANKFISQHIQEDLISKDEFQV